MFDGYLLADCRNTQGLFVVHGVLASHSLGGGLLNSFSKSDRFFTIINEGELGITA